MPRALLVLYGCIMLFLLFDRTPEQIESTYFETMKQNLNYIPFHSIRIYLYLLRTGGGGVAAYYRYAFINFYGNILLFIPLGILLCAAALRMRVFWRCMTTALGIFLAVELTQLLTLRGSFDVDDILMNLLGVLIGYCIWTVGEWMYRRQKERRKE